MGIHLVMWHGAGLHSPSPGPLLLVATVLPGSFLACLAGSGTANPQLPARDQEFERTGMASGCTALASRRVARSFG